MKKIFVGSVLSIFSGISFLSCAIQPAWERQEFNTNINAPTSSPGAFKVFSNTFTSPSRLDDYLTNSYLIQTVYENALKITKNGILKENKDKLDKTYNYEISQPSYSWNAFVNAKAILVTKNDGKEELFDSDAHEKGYLKQGEKTNLLVIKLKSEQKNSINSEFFAQALENAKKVQIFLKNNINWVNYQGLPTGFYLKPRDYFYGFRTQRLSEQKYRVRFGGGFEIDKIAQEKIPNFDPKSDYFVNTIGNFYLLELFGLDPLDFDNEAKYIQEYKGSLADFKGKKALSFQKGVTKEKVFFNNFFEKIILTGMLRPVPADFIDKRNKEITKKQKEDGKLVGRFGESGDALRFGAYWYGEDFKKDLLYNSPYTQTVFNQQKRTWKINEYYPRTNWKENLPYTFKKINWLYSKYASPSAFKNSQFNSYREQTIMGVSFDSLSESQKNLVASNQKKYGWNLNRQETKNSLHKWYYSVLVPGSLKQKFRPETGVSFDEKYYGFNDNFAKLNYGVSLQDIAVGKAKIIDNLISGPSLEFRQIIANAYNLYTTAQTMQSQSLAWYNFVAPDNKISSKPNSKTPRDFYKFANTIKLVDSQGKIYYEKDAESEKQQNFANVNDAKKQFQAPNFALLKDRMKKLLDKFWQDNKLTKDEKVEWTSHSFYTNTPDQVISAINNAADAIESLDPRLKINRIWPITDLARRTNYLYTRTGGLDYGGWNYDYNGIGTVFDGKIQKNGVGYAILSAIYAKGANSEIAKSYPHVFKYALETKKYFDKFAKKGYIRKFEDWKDATNSPDYGADDQHLAPDLINFIIGSVVENEDPQNPGKKIKTWKSFVDVLNEQKLENQEEIIFDFLAESAVFNLIFQEDNSDQELILLSSELSSLLGFGLNDLLSVSSSTPYAFLQNPNIESPQASDTYDEYVPPDMIFIKPLREKLKKNQEKGEK
ncbi:OppA family ABC transporter substrate-binding lipoprotein [Mesomycoplasma flocculare]|uniref:Oligopeptide ABC transporter substrate-binding lipoprotein OppA n=1 Tax=Mesomycoplasma flocculare ATCC 27399 TaxID=743971 RepID=A0A0A8E7Y9_MESFC|nr:hypothetical protein [Mesomycoplasma flocculare]AJC49732.1 oligopeptide ABC transporter substrate-binding lipoprotein OppA [Mesomycoplasma flocculare ATCC 27399]ENX51128.1 lipoprotein [Mesomycoplasma flocculare ATCC 27716]